MKHTRPLAITAVIAISGAIALATPSTASAEPDPPRTWVALGDSYSAGIIAGTVETPIDGCLRTADAYPRVAHRAARPDLRLVHEACGNAKTEHLFTPQVPLSVGDDPVWPAVAPQAEALGTDTEIVTIGMGGNTVGFGNIILRCLLLGTQQGHENPGTPCQNSYQADASAGSIGSLESKVRSTVDEFAAALREIRTAAPNARIVTVGYPQITPADPTTCTWGDKQQFDTVARGDLPFFRLVEERLNEGLEAVTTEAGASFVDTYGISTGHDVCSPADDRWIEGMYLDAAGTEPVYVHPNSDGHRAFGHAVADAVLSPLPPSAVRSVRGSAM